MKTTEEVILHLARTMMGAGDQAQLVRQMAMLVREAVEADWAGVWIYDRRSRRYTLDCAVPEETVRPLAKKAGRKGDLLSETLARKAPVIARGNEVTGDRMQHFGEPSPIAAAEVFCVSFTLDNQRIGLLELVRRNATTPAAQAGQAHLLSAVAAMASSAAAAMVRAQAGSESQLAAINRLMQLYDVSQAFHSTLELDGLVPIVANRIASILEAPHCRIWLAQAGEKAIVCAFPEPEGDGDRLEEGAAIPWKVFESGESALIPDVREDEHAGSIEEFYGPGQAGSVIAAPLTVDDTALGVVEAIREPGGTPFAEDDRDFLEELGRQAAIALRNCNLFQAEKKAAELGALLDISREITSTLDLDRVLATIVNRADAIVPAERCAILLAEGTRLELRAVSGHLEIDRKAPHIQDLEAILSWAHMGGQGMYVSEQDGQIETEREETREKFRRYFERSGMKTFVSIPLKDEEGHLGTLSVESGTPYFVTEDQLEVFNILANQATVAVRNASLYRQIPLINLMQPIAGWRARLKKIPRWSRLRAGAAAAAVLLALVLVPWNMKIAGRVVVLPEKSSLVTAEIEGVVEAIYVREGDRVHRGQLVATQIDRERRLRVEEARARYEVADQEVAQHEAALEPVPARQARTRRDRLREEFAIVSQDLEKTRIASPVDGVVLTPRLERRVGTRLDRGEVLCRIADMSDIGLEILVRESDLAYVREGQRVRVKIDSFPTETLHARVDLLGHQVTEEQGGRYVTVRARMEAGGRVLRTGMVGRAKIETGYRSVGYVLLRRPVRYLWLIFWSWLP
jgi:transcriptional regulator with GAF, ATPase, and Fis domain/multidrug resistance efflux pump